MHDTALEYGGLFFKTYAGNGKSIKILDLGSQDVNGSLRTVAPKKAEYVGVDFADGKGVDIKITDPYKLPFEDNFFDVAVSSSCFEHSEFFWLSFLELLRVLKPEGLLYINAPSNGSFHRYPLDCWRFYPDSGIALQNWAHRNGLKEAALLESFIGTQKKDMWNDFIAVFIKSKKYNSHYEKRMISFLSEYSNAHLLGSEEVLNFKDQSFDQLVISTQESKIQTQENLLNLMLNSRSWKITKPLRFIKIKIGVLALFLKYENYIKFFDLLIRHGLLDTLKIIKFKTSSNVNYDDWIKSYDNFDNYNKKLAKKEIKNFKSLPLFSIVMPTYNSNIAWLKSAIESVQNQVYPNWELCIADDASTNKNVEATLREFMAKDKRIKVVFRKKNGHISEASNSAVNLANGDWVGFLDHDDIMAPHALYHVAKAINSHSGLKIIYSDEDKIDIKNKRSRPYFKPDWNEDLFLSHNLLTHLVLYRHGLIKKIGGFRTEFNGAQDYDLALRCIEVINSKEIFHIPHILYHWRMHDLSTAKSHKAKPYAMLAGEKALNEHFLRMKIKAKAEHLNIGYRVRYALPKKLPLVSLIIPTRNGLEVFKKCIESILSKTIYSNYEIIIVDNGSDDQKILKYMKELSLRKNISLIKDARDFNYSTLNNLGVSVSRGSIIGLINNDIEVISPDWLSEMVSHAIRKGVGAVGAKLYYPNNTIQHAGVILGLGGHAGHSHRFYPRVSFGPSGRLMHIQSYSAVTGACLVIKKSIYQEVGGLDEEKFKVAFNDVDFCLKVLSKGYKNIWTPYAELYHYESATRGHDDTSEKKARFELEKFYLRKKWNAYIKHDPAYNPNLTLDREDFSLALPPRL